MLCRFSTLLPFDITMPVTPVVPPVEWRSRGMRIKVLPFSKAVADRSDFVFGMPMRPVLVGLVPVDPQPVSPGLEVEGQSAVLADLLQIDFKRARFDRRPVTAATPQEGIAQGDPPPALAFDVANQWLGRIRSLYRAPGITSLVPGATPWRMQYLHDDLTPLRKRMPYIRTRQGGLSTMEFTVAFPGAWQAAADLGPTYRAPAWQTLLLEAFRLLPDVNAPIVLAFFAIETLIGEALPQLPATQKLPVGLWEWIANRDGNYLKQPSVSEELDPLLGALAGRGLSAEKDLWKAFQELRKARNSLAHEGRPRLLNKELVTSADAERLVRSAGAIADWIDQQLPRRLRLPINPPGPTFTSLVQVVTA